MRVTTQTKPRVVATKGVGGGAVHMKKGHNDLMRAFRVRAGLSGPEIAKAAGYSAPSGYYAFESHKYKDKKIPHESMKRLIPIFVGRGAPPITVDELLAISDSSDMGPATKAALSAEVKTSVSAMELEVRTSGALLEVRGRIEAGSLVDLKRNRQYGLARIAVGSEYPAGKQSAVIITDDSVKVWYAAGTHLHLVTADEFGTTARQGKRAVILRERSKDVAEVVLVRIGLEDVLTDIDGNIVTGAMLGVVIGAYQRE